ncbi:MAG: adenosine deaminase [Alteromonadaceae bacterium]|nr:MAG: adenosine deaminase [Alteromonadaceae bacterium]
MNITRYLLISVSLMLLQACNTASIKHISDSSDYEITRSFYQSMIKPHAVDIAKLNLFFTNMPKGGDLHHHYSGTIYAETYLDWVQKKNWHINQCSLKIISKQSNLDGDGNGDCPDITVEQLYRDDALFRKLLTLWSDKDFSNHSHNQTPPDANFFNTFGYFGPISSSYTATGLKILKARAIAENVGYIETMLSRVDLNSADFFGKGEVAARFNAALREAKTDAALFSVLDEVRAKIDQDPSFTQSIDAYVKRVEQYHQGIDDDDFSMRFQTYAVRILSPLQVFLDLYSGYLAAEISDVIVGVNIVAPENNLIALADYRLHMNMYAYLGDKYPRVNRALHAGELTIGMVRPKELNFHINDAIYIAKAQRIGHGIDIPYEKNILTLLASMKAHAAVEINLTSNEFILGVEKSAHPYSIYAEYGVPMVISTDDSGVSRNNLSHEYVLLASRYRPDYETVKKYVYNSIEYSFLSEEDKQRNKNRLDVKFSLFEQEMAELYRQTLD